MKRALMLVCSLLILGAGEVISFDNNWGDHPLFNVLSQNSSGMEITFSMHQMTVENQTLDGVEMKTFGVPSVFIANPGKPNLGGASRYVAIPKGADVKITIIDARTQVYHNIDVPPAPNNPPENEDSPLRYEKDMTIYGQNAYWPPLPVAVSSKTQIRGVDVVLVGVMPFQYNPVTKELIIYQDIRFRIDFIGGNGHFGEDRLRSRFWEPILQGNLLNYCSLPKIDFYSPERTKARAGFEYIIIVPDDPVFIAWGDTIKNWRKLQGISADVFTLTEVGGSTTTAIKNFLRNAYNTWDPAPVAFLLLSDYPSSGDSRTYGITTFVLSHPYGYDAYASDNRYADFTGDSLPEMHHARICAQNASQLSVMINKFLSYERNPYSTPSFYNVPLLACGWQSDRWFQLCIEICYGFYTTKLGKTPDREYKVYSGTPTPGCAWCTRPGTTPVVTYFNNLGYVAMTNPYDYNFWNSGSATGITATINAGTMHLQHRDHGSETGWGEPAYSSTNLNSLTNTMFTFVNSTNCLTGKYHWSSECFSEKFHRINYGAVGVNAASSVSISFVNDTYIWGMFDSYWPQFDPGYPSYDMTGYDNLMLCQAMTNGKYYLAASTWPLGISGITQQDYVLTYGLFHHLGDCFQPMYSVVPMNLTVNHPSTIFTNTTSMPVSANDSSVIALTVNNEIIGVAEGTGSVVNIPIPAQSAGTIIKVTVTKVNYRRYQADVQVVAQNYPFVNVGKMIINDTGGDGKINPGESVNLGIYALNQGVGTAQQVYGLLSENDSYTTISTDSSWFGNIPQGDSALSSPYYVFAVVDNTPDSHQITLTFDIQDVNDTVWTVPKQFLVLSPILTYQKCLVQGGNGNSILDPGETANLVVTIKNQGSAAANNTTSKLRTSSPYIIITDSTANFGTISSGDTVNNVSDPYTVVVDSATPIGTTVQFTMEISAFGYCDTVNFSLVISSISEGSDLMNLVNRETLAIIPSVSDGTFNIAYGSKPNAQSITLQIFDATGRAIKLFRTPPRGPFNQIRWQGDDDEGRKVPTGIYFVRLDIDDLKIIDKAVIVK